MSPPADTALAYNAPSFLSFLLFEGYSSSAAIRAGIGLRYCHGQSEHCLESILVFADPSCDEVRDVDINYLQGFRLAKIFDKRGRGYSEYRQTEKDPFHVGMIVEYTVIRR